VEFSTGWSGWSPVAGMDELCWTFEFWYLILNGWLYSFRMD